MQKEDRRYQRTCQAISDVMWQLMKEKDFTQISVSEIAERANINRVTFYRHYEDKYAWLNNCIQELVQELFGITSNISSVSETQNLNQIFLDICNYFDRNYQTYSILLRNDGIHFIREQFKQIIFNMPIENITSLENMPPEEQMKRYFLLSAVTGTMEWWIKNERPMTPDVLAHKLASIYQAIP